MDSSLFFHPPNEQMPERRRRINAAKAICGSCPAVDDCRTHALTVQEPYGIWGGMSERDRASPSRGPIHAISRTTIRSTDFRPDASDSGATAPVCECRQRLTARVGGRAKPCPAPNISSLPVLRWMTGPGWCGTCGRSEQKPLSARDVSTQCGFPSVPSRHCLRGGRRRCRQGCHADQVAASRTSAVSTNCSNLTIRPPRTMKW